MNLTRVPKDESWIRHFADSLLFESVFTEGSQVLDIGTGPGFPAWPLACARPDLKVTAIDSSGKMLGFLEKTPLPNLNLVQVRAEEWDMREQFDFVTGRALAPLPVQLELSAPLCRIGGFVTPMRTPSDQVILNSVDLLGLRLEAVKSRQLPDSTTERVMPLYKKVAPANKIYPRRWAEIKKNPLA